jgi:hypothetical protein
MGSPADSGSGAVAFERSLCFQSHQPERITQIQCLGNFSGNIGFDSD